MNKTIEVQALENAYHEYEKNVDGIPQLAEYQRGLKAGILHAIKVLQDCQDLPIIFNSIYHSDNVGGNMHDAVDFINRRLVPNYPNLVIITIWSDGHHAIVVWKE